MTVHPPPVRTFQTWVAYFLWSYRPPVYLDRARGDPAKVSKYTQIDPEQSGGGKPFKQIC